MCLSPKMPPPPEPPPPPPAPVVTGNQPTTVKPTTSKRSAMQQASRGPSSLSIPLGGTASGGGDASTSLSNLSIGK